jgi:hypothetical protein
MCFSQNQQLAVDPTTLHPVARHRWRKIAISLIMALRRALECNRLWLLKKSVFLKTAKIWGIENV